MPPPGEPRNETLSDPGSAAPSPGLGGVDARTPVLVGVGQRSQRVDEGAEVLEPVDLMATAVQEAFADASAPGLASRVESVRVMASLSWPYTNPGALVAERIGAPPGHTAVTVMGGNYPQTMVNQACRDIAAGHADVIVVCGAEAWKSRSAARRAGSEPDWTHQDPDAVPDTIYGEGLPELSSPAETTRGVFMPVQVYPMFDVALRAAAGLSVDDHRKRISTLWSRFSEVAANNPDAWTHQALTPEEVATPSSTNRMVGFPYTKVMNANNNVEQGAAVVVCSAAAAAAAGVPREQWVFPHAGTEAHDHWWISERADLHSSPAIRLAGQRCLDLAGIGVEDIAHVDLYSCFPSAVQVAANELGFDLDRPLTVTGGLSFAGGPWNNYVTHAIAAMTHKLRNDPGACGLVSANGGYLTKHSFGVYSTEPPAAGFRFEDCQGAVDALPRRRGAPENYEGPATIEAYTVMHDHDGPTRALAAFLTADGARTFAGSSDSGVMANLMADEWVGSPVHVFANGDFTPTP